MERLFNGQLEADQCRLDGKTLCDLKRKPQRRTVVFFECVAFFQFNNISLHNVKVLLLQRAEMKQSSVTNICQLCRWCNSAG